MKNKPLLSFGNILSMSLGFMGIQMGFAIQNANASRILQTYGADVEHLSWFWIVAPLTGMIVQPIVGHYSDNTWCKLGRRRPFFLVGAIITAIALILMPNAGLFAKFMPAVFVGAGFLMIMDASINVTMEPFRALVADMLPAKQATVGFAVQTFLIGIGAVVGSWLPYVLLNWFGIGADLSESGVPLNLVYSFYIAAAILLITIIWTVTNTKEYSPEELAEFNGESVVNERPKFSEMFRDVANMPRIMKQLGLVQFFSWIALFGMWVYTTPAVAQQIFNETDPNTELFQTAGDWVGILFGVYNFVAMLFALFLIPISNKLGRKTTHAIALTIGAISLISIGFITNKNLLILPMVGVGIAWASILAMPYAMLAPNLPQNKMGVYMGIFNFFITIPQIVNALFSGLILKYCFASNSVWMLVLSGCFLILGACSVMYIKEKK
ncbi:MAG: MFS transporter [Paludibacteraceae bacterium]|nr:MFS transporter [Paludibacteraceae bacterium]